MTSLKPAFSIDERDLVSGRHGGQCSCDQGSANRWVASIRARDSGTVSGSRRPLAHHSASVGPTASARVGALHGVVRHVLRLGLAMGETAAEQAAHAAVAPALAGHEQIARAGETEHCLDATAERTNKVLKLAERPAEHRGRGLPGGSRDG
jgi:hypothetical protein